MGRSSTRNSSMKTAPSLPADLGEGGSPSSIPKVPPKKKTQTTKSPIPEKAVVETVTPEKAKNNGGEEMECSSNKNKTPTEDRKETPQGKKDNNPTETKTHVDKKKTDSEAPPVTPDQPIKNPYTAARKTSMKKKKTGASPKALKFISSASEESGEAKATENRSIYDFGLGAKKPDHDGTIQFQFMQGVKKELYLLVLITANNPASGQFHGEKVWFISIGSLRVGPHRSILTPLTTFTFQRMKDEIHGQASWTRDLGFITAMKVYHINDVPQRNGKNYKVPLFMLKYPNPLTPDQVPVESLYTMGSYIADKLNAVKSYYDNKTFCHKEKLFFGSPDDVWADTIGTVDAWKELCWHHPITDFEWYDNYHNDLHLYFKEGELPMEFAEMIGAPPEEVREAERAQYWEKVKQAEMRIAEQIFSHENSNTSDDKKMAANPSNEKDTPHGNSNTSDEKKMPAKAGNDKDTVLDGTAHHEGGKSAVDENGNSGNSAGSKRKNNPSKSSAAQKKHKKDPSESDDDDEEDEENENEKRNADDDNLGEDCKDSDTASNEGKLGEPGLLTQTQMD